MAKNMFINTTGLEVEKQIPALRGIDMSGFQKTGAESDIGEVISSLAEKSRVIKEKQNLVRLKNALDNEEAQYKAQYLSDPNAFVNEDSRKAILSAYNDLVERKKALISGAKGNVSADQYSQVEDYFKEQTYNSLYNTQYNINVGYIKERTDDVILESNNILENLLSIDDPNLRDNRIQDAIDLMNGLKEFGVDPKEMQLQYLVKAQKRMTDYEVNSKIINSTDERFWLRDKNGDIVRDSNGNPYMDNAKKNTALLALQNTFLSDEEISNSAKAISKKIGVDFDVAKSYIRNNREGDWLRIAQESRSKFMSEDNAINAKIIAEERKINEAGYDNQQKVRDKIDKDVKEFGGLVLGRTMVDDDLYDPHILRTFTNDKYADVNKLASDGYYIRTLSDSEINNLQELYDNKDYGKLSTLLSQAVGNDYGDDTKNTLQEFKSQQIGDALNMKQNTINALAGRSNVLSSEEAQSFMLADKTLADIDVTRIEYNSYLSESGLDMNLDGETFQLASKMILTSNDRTLASFRNQEVIEVYNKEKVLSAIFKQAKSNKNLRDKLDDLFRKAKYLNGGSTKIAYNFNTGDSLLMRQAYQTGMSSETMKRAGTLDKEGVLAQGMLITQAGNNQYNLPKGTADYKIEMLKNQSYTVKDLTSMDWDNAYFRKNAVGYVLRDLDSGSLKALDVPSKILELPEINDYFKKKMESSQ